MGRHRVPVLPALLAICLLASSAAPARASGIDLSLFGGLAFPTYEHRFTVRAPTVAPLPGFVIRPNGDLTIDAEGGTVFGAALCAELGVIGIEARFDSTAIDLRTAGLNYQVSYSAPPLPTFTGSVSVDPGPLATDRLKLLSVNLRLRTPGPVSLLASGGLTYLPDFEVTGTTPVRLTVNGLPVLDEQTSFGLRVAPTESSHRVGVNGGAGLRVQVAPAVSLFAEGRVFYFKEYELSIEVDDPTLAGFVGDIEQPRFRPIVVNAVAGLTFTF